jgi:hypothetical protein
MMKKKLLLGEVLHQANLVSSSQIEEALRQQSEQPKCLIGGILARQGWIKQETVDFFAEQWTTLLSQTKESTRRPIGFYFQQAGLLDRSQIETLLVKQKQIRPWVKFRELAVSQGYLNQKTVEFFVEHLSQEYFRDSDKIHSDVAQSKLVQASRQRTEQLIDWLRDYAQRRINSQLIDERRCITPHIVLDFGKQGLLGMIVPESYGVLGLNYRQMFSVIEQIAAIDINLAIFVGLNRVC